MFDPTHTKLATAWQHIPLAAAAAASFLLSCTAASKTDSETDNSFTQLRDSLYSIADEYPGEIGIAVITGNADTVLVNNEDKYPLMSVFKLHQAIGVCRQLEQNGTSLDSMVTINRADLNPDTWSPMLKDYADTQINITVRNLLRYALQQSDNNASNYLFDNFRSVAGTDCLIATIIPRDDFRLTVTEAQMRNDHSLCYSNHSSPLGAAALINRLYLDSIAGAENLNFMRTTLRECRTGADRIAAPLQGKEGVTVGHKTGSGFRNEKGILTAHNDVAFITLPDGSHYSLSVLVKDFNGSEQEAAAAIARISETVYSFIANGCRFPDKAQ